MKFCMPHWEALKDGVRERGLWHLVAQSGEALGESVQRQISGNDTKADFDPLAAATWAIYGNALECGGLYLMSADENGNEYCPLCEVDQNAGGRTSAEEWIRGCLDSQLDHARALGLAPAKQ